MLAALDQVHRLVQSAPAFQLGAKLSISGLRMAIQMESTCGRSRELAQRVNQDGNSVEFQKLLGERAGLGRRAERPCAFPDRLRE